jgi:hypothetical protein
MLPCDARPTACLRETGGEVLVRSRVGIGIEQVQPASRLEECEGARLAVRSSR